MHRLRGEAPVFCILRGGSRHCSRGQVGAAGTEFLHDVLIQAGGLLCRLWPGDRCESSPRRSWNSSEAQRFWHRFPRRKETIGVSPVMAVSKRDSFSRPARRNSARLVNPRDHVTRKPLDGCTHFLPLLLNGGDLPRSTALLAVVVWMLTQLRPGLNSACDPPRLPK